MEEAGASTSAPCIPAPSVPSQLCLHVLSGPTLAVWDESSSLLVVIHLQGSGALGVTVQGSPIQLDSTTGTKNVFKSFVLRKPLLGIFSGSGLWAKIGIPKK